MPFPCRFVAACAAAARAMRWGAVAAALIAGLSVSTTASAAYPCGTDISSSTTITPTSRATSAPGSMTFSFTTQNNVSNANPRVIVTFPAGFSVAGASVSNVSGISAGAASVSGQVVTIPATAQIEVGAKSFTLSPIMNPGTTGSYDIDLEVRDNPGCQDSAQKSISITGPLSNVGVQAADLNAGATGNYTVTFDTATVVPASGTVKVAFPAGYDVSGATYASSQNLEAGTPLVSVSGRVVSVALGNTNSIATGGSRKELVLGGIRNPLAGGWTGNFEVATADASGELDSGSANSVSITGDALPPEVSSFTTSTASPTTSTSITWDLVMDEAVSGLVAGDFSVGGTSSGWTVSAIAGLGANYTVTLVGSGATGGTVFPVLAANSVVDSFSNQGPTSVQNGAAVTFSSGGGGGGDGGEVPDAPRSVTATPGDASAAIAWQKPRGRAANTITGYTATASPGGASCTTTGLGCTIAGLTNGTSYTVTVVARNSDGTGPGTTSSPFTPTAPSSATAGKKNANDNRPRPRVTLCHATKSATNPYVVITVDPNSVITQGHDQHQDGRDIIPAFTYEENGSVVSYPGKNLTPDGLALLANGCKPSATTSVAAALILAAKPGPKKSKVTLCHATSSTTNPYVRITVAPEAVYIQGHDQHQDGRDIIPPFSYDDNGVTREYPGKNWDSESQAIFSNGCKPLKPETGPASLSATVTFCAALGGGQYVRTTATVQEVLQRGGGNGDIIPPFTYSDNGTRSFAGLNWSTSARSILDAGCVAPIPTTPTSPVEPVVTCINVNDDGSFSAVFGYLNPNAVAVSQPVGAGNAIALGAGADGATIGTVPTRFMPGSLDVAVTVSGIGEDGSVTWTIAAPGEARTATATGASPRCTAPATTPEVSVRAECVIDQGNGTYAARFGYQSDETGNVSVPLGPLNTLTQSSGGPVGQIQTTTFQPGLIGSAFTVSGVRSRASVTWRVVTGATTRTATASLSTLPSCFAPAPPPPGAEPTPGGPTSAGDVPPYQVPNPGPGGNVTCEQLGYANSSGRINYSDAGFTQSFSRQGITVSVSSGTYVTWSTAFPVGAVIVKGGPRANVYQYSPGRYGDTGLASPVNASGNPAGLSNLTVCWNPGAPGPDPNAPTTNPTSTPTPPSPPGTPPGTDPPASPLVEPDVPEPIGVAVSCVKKNTDGTYDAVFSYTNPNMMSVEIPGGAANYVAEGPTDPESQLRGQPTSFLPGSTPVAFVVSGVPAAKTVTWTVAYYGTRQATADVNYPSACVLTKINSLPVVDPNPPSTPTPRVDPTDPNSAVPGPPAVAPPSPRTVQLGVYLQCVDVRSRTYSATFGYVNPNGTALPIPVGPANRMVGARSYDRGQPGVFAPGSNAAAFTVTSIPRSSTPSWQVTLPSGQVVSATATQSAPRCSVTSRPPGPGLATTITTPRRVPTRSRVRTTVTVSNPGTKPLYDVDVAIPTPRNLSRPTKVTPPPGARCVVTGSRTVCTLSSLMPGTTRSIALLSRSSVPGTRMPLSRAAGLSSSGTALTAVDTTPLTVIARAGQPVTG